MVRAYTPMSGQSRSPSAYAVGHSDTWLLKFLHLLNWAPLGTSPLLHGVVRRRRLQETWTSLISSLDEDPPQPEQFNDQEIELHMMAWVATCLLLRRFSKEELVGGRQEDIAEVRSNQGPNAHVRAVNDDSEGVKVIGEITDKLDNSIMDLLENPTGAFRTYLACHYVMHKMRPRTRDGCMAPRMRKGSERVALDVTWETLVLTTISDRSFYEVVSLEEYVEVMPLMRCAASKLTRGDFASQNSKMTAQKWKEEHKSEEKDAQNLQFSGQAESIDPGDFSFVLDKAKIHSSIAAGSWDTFRLNNDDLASLAGWLTDRDHFQEVYTANGSEYNVYVAEHLDPQKRFLWKYIGCLLVQSTLYYGALDINGVSFGNGGTPEFAGNTIFNGIVVIFIAFYTFYYAVAVSIQNMPPGCFFFMGTNAMKMTIPEFIPLLANFAANVIMPTTLAYSTSLFLAQSTDFKDTILDSVAVYFLIDLDDQLITNRDVNHLHACVVLKHVRLFKVFTPGMGSEIREGLSSRLNRIRAEFVFLFVVYLTSLGMLVTGIVKFVRF